jgi:catechol 2,3-dioxygenase-like lactoylglutathione lyase family enzyme
MRITGFHPILYVSDPSIERDFYTRFGFTTAYEGDDFPGFIAVRCGDVIFGLSSDRVLPDDRPYDSSRWQLMVDDPNEIVAICAAEGWTHEVQVEAPSRAHWAQLVKVLSPNGVTVWFEGPNQAAASSPQPVRKKSSGAP